MQLFNTFLPSSKIKQDINLTYTKLDALKPINIKGISLIAPIKRRVLLLRKQQKEIKLKTGNHFLSLIVPYRHRKEHLNIFLPFIHNYLKQQNLKYEIIVVEQDDKLPFNKAKLMNIGAKYSDKRTQYFIFHDVDLLPQNIDYHFKNHTTKLFNFIKENGENKKYGETIFGGAILIPKNIFYTINGFSNNYWQWGKEDDDFLMRHLLKGFVPFINMKGAFQSLRHEKSLKRDVDGNYKDDNALLKKNKQYYKKNKKHFSNFKRGLISQEDDGVNSLNRYTIKDISIENHIKTIKVSLND